MSERHAVQMRGITKRYPRTLANDRVDLDVEVGEVHAIVGENGAGKSTIMKVLYGLTPPDAGKISLWGRELSGHRPSDAIREGVGMVHQHFMLVDTLTVADAVSSMRRRPANACGSCRRSTVCRSTPTNSSRTCRWGSSSASR
jgi:simple sugar transport system ATP-binding protein